MPGINRGIAPDGFYICNSSFLTVTRQNFNKNMKNKEKQIEYIKTRINKLLKKNFLLKAAISLANWSLKNYDNGDWEAYEEETGNPRCDFEMPKSALESLIDKSCGLDQERVLAIGKFLLWNIKEFEKGMKIEF